MGTMKGSCRDHVRIVRGDDLRASGDDALAYTGGRAAEADAAAVGESEEMALERTPREGFDRGSRGRYAEERPVLVP